MSPQSRQYAGPARTTHERRRVEQWRHATCGTQRERRAALARGQPTHQRAGPACGDGMRPWGWACGISMQRARRAVSARDKAHTPACGVRMTDARISTRSTDIASERSSRQEREWRRRCRGGVGWGWGMGWAERAGNRDGVRAGEQAAACQPTRPHIITSPPQNAGDEGKGQR